jgi:hypothetical protein
MISLLESMFYVISVINSTTIVPHPCTTDISHLNLNQKIEFSIGCSRINGKYAYKRGRLNAIAKFR